MNLPPFKLQERTENAVVLALEVLLAHEAFAGHFPQKPILPGVVQIDWVMQMAVEFFDLQGAYAGDIQIKFKDTILPSKPLLLSIQFDRPNSKLIFSYTSGEDLMSKGRIKLVAAE